MNVRGSDTIIPVKYGHTCPRVLTIISLLCASVLHECDIHLPLIIAVIDHGIASIELVMEEALQDIPPLVHDIQERLKGKKIH